MDVEAKIKRLQGSAKYALNRFRYGWLYEPIWTRWMYQIGMFANEVLPAKLQERYELRLSPGDCSAFPRLKIEGKGLLIAPNNWAGQAAQWARAASTLPGVTGVNLQFDHGSHLRYPAEKTVKKIVVQRSAWWTWQLNRWIDNNITHVLVESTRPFLGNFYPDDIRSQVDSLRKRGKRVAFLWHGSDARLPQAHLDKEPYSYFRTFPQHKFVVDQGKVEASHALVDELGFVEFVSTPGLLPYRPNAIWLPQLYDVDRWKAPKPEDVVQRAVPVVAHIPSHPYIKGTELISRVCQKLAEEGVIDYVTISGLPPEEMPGAIGAADIVIDQIGDPNYGSAAIEAMASGKVVCGLVGEEVPEVVRATYGIELPIVNINDDNLEDVLRGLAADPQRRKELAIAGPKYVKYVHTTKRAADLLWDNFLQFPPASAMERS